MLCKVLFKLCQPIYPQVIRLGEFLDVSLHRTDRELLVSCLTRGVSCSQTAMESIPTHREIDALAHFVETARELKGTAYFKEEHRSLSISRREGESDEQMRGKFPDMEIVRSAIVPFRRLWQEREPCNHRKVANILRRYVEEYRDFLEPLEFNDKTALAGQLFEWTRNSGMTPSQVIDLWLNTKHHHTGRDNRAGKYTRDDFERFNKQLGPVRNEFYFLYSLNEVGTWFFNLLICASRYLEILAAQGHKPSFDYCAPEDSRIERSTPGFSPEPDGAPRQRVWRLRRRFHYDGVNRFFEITELPDDRVATLLSKCETFDALTEACRFMFEHTDDFEARFQQDESVNFMTGCLDNNFTVARNRKCRRGFIARRPGAPFLIGEDFLPIVREQYSEFRNAFLKEHFE